MRVGVGGPSWGARVLCCAQVVVCLAQTRPRICVAQVRAAGRVGRIGMSGVAQNLIAATRTSAHSFVCTLLVA